MATRLRLLIIEDVEDHALLLARELQKGGIDPLFERVETAQELAAALDGGPWDAIISDYSLPAFTGLDALEIVHNKGLDLPFILVSGAIGEEKAAEVMKAGAHDYIRKGSFARLVPSLERAIQDARVRWERRQSAEELARYREHLEELVQVRTEELAAAHEELQMQNEELQAQGEELQEQGYILQAQNEELRVQREELRNALDEIELINRELRDSREQLRLMLDGIMDYAIFMLDPQGRILTWNEGVERIKGYGAQEIIGRHFSCFYCQEEIEQGKPDKALKKAEADGRYEEEGCRVRKDGSRFWASVIITPLYDDRGSLRGFSKVTRDISERKRAELELERLNSAVAAHAADLAAANQELEAFNYSAAHDLRQPLNAMSGYCQVIEVLCGDQLTGECKDYIREVYDGSLRMNGLIEALLKFSQMGHVEPQREMVDLGALARDVVRMLKQNEPGRQVDIRIADGLAASADASLLRAVLDNLLGNAWKYSGTREDALIEFGATDIDGAPVYFVRDNGAGFDMAYADKLFVPFQRLPGTEDAKGFGIGLATVERIIRRHGGRVWAEAEPGKGATFYFTLPSNPLSL